MENVLPFDIEIINDEKMLNVNVNIDITSNELKNILKKNY